MEIVTPSPPKKVHKPKKETVNYSPKEKQGCSPLIGFILIFGFVVSVYMLLQSPSATEHPTKTIPSDAPKKQNTLEFDEVIIRNPDGTYRLHPKRSEKLHRDTVNLESSEQYALRATTSKYYPCLSCPYRDSIFLYSGEIWKYRITINGQSKRYGNSLNSQFSHYFVQFRGTIHECLKQRRIKIIRYPLLPENIKRKNPIARPPAILTIIDLSNKICIFEKSKLIIIETTIEIKMPRTFAIGFVSNIPSWYAFKTTLLNFVK